MRAANLDVSHNQSMIDGLIGATGSFCQPHVPCFDYENLPWSDDFLHDITKWKWHVQNKRMDALQSHPSLPGAAQDCMGSNGGSMTFG